MPNTLKGSRQFEKRAFSSKLKKHNKVKWPSPTKSRPMYADQITISDETVRSLVCLHNANILNGNYIRKLAKRQVSRVSQDGLSYIVKAYKISWWKRLLFAQPGKPAGDALLKGFTPECVGIISQHGWHYTIYQDAGAHSMLDIQGMLAANLELEECFQAAGSVLAMIHKRNLYHVDTKPPNFVVNTNLKFLPRVVVVDCDRVLSYANLPFRRRAFNLAQFISGGKPFPEIGMQLQCLEAFLVSYGKTAGIQNGDLTELLSSAMGMARSNKRIEKRAPKEILDKYWRF